MSGRDEAYVVAEELSRRYPPDSGFNDDGSQHSPNTRRLLAALRETHSDMRRLIDAVLGS